MPVSAYAILESEAYEVAFLNATLVALSKDASSASGVNSVAVPSSSLYTFTLSTPIFKLFFFI